MLLLLGFGFCSFFSFSFLNVLSVNGLTLLSALSASVEAFQSEGTFEKSNFLECFEKTENHIKWL